MWLTGFCRACYPPLCMLPTLPRYVVVIAVVGHCCGDVRALIVSLCQVLEVVSGYLKDTLALLLHHITRDTKSPTSTMPSSTGEHWWVLVLRASHIFFLFPVGRARPGTGKIWLACDPRWVALW